MDEIRKGKVVPAVSAKEAVVMKGVATVSLNPDGKINFAVDKAVFLDSIRNAIEFGADCPEHCNNCLRDCLEYLSALTGADIRVLYDKGILTDRDFTAAQLKVIRSIRV